LLSLGVLPAWYGRADGRAHAAPGKALPSTSVAFVRSPGTRAGEGGDVFLWDARTGLQRPLTRGGHFSGLAPARGRMACLHPADGTLYLLSPPEWRPHLLPVGGGYSGTPCWLPGKNQFLVGRSRADGADGDGGLWLVDVGHQHARRLLPDYNADYPISTNILLSPSGNRAAAGGGGEDLVLRVLDLKTGYALPGLGGKSFASGGGFAWLDEDDLLVACSPKTAEDEPAPGGLRLLNVRTRRVTRWLYSSASDVAQVVGSKRGDRFAVSLSAPDRVEIITAATKTRHPLALSGPTSVKGFSPDDRSLLVSVSRPQGAQAEDACVLNLQTAQQRLVARGVSEAVWIVP